MAKRNSAPNTAVSNNDQEIPNFNGEGNLKLADFKVDPKNVEPPKKETKPIGFSGTLSVTSFKR